MTWKQELGFLQHLADVAAHLSLLSSFQRCSHSTSLPPFASAVGWTLHHFAEFRGMAPYKWLWLLEEFVPHFFLSSEVSMCKSITSPLDSALLEPPTLTQRDFGRRKEKLQKHWVLKCANIYWALKMETCQGEAFLCERKADLLKRERERCSPILPSTALKRVCQEHSADVNHSRAAGSTVPCPFHTTHHFSRPPVPVWQQRPDLGWLGVPWLTACRALLSRAEGHPAVPMAERVDLLCDNPRWWQVSYDTP